MLTMPTPRSIKLHEYKRIPIQESPELLELHDMNLGVRWFLSRVFLTGKCALCECKRE